MALNIPHIIATGLIVFAVIALIDHASAFESMTKGRKSVLKFTGIFVAVFLLNLVWPYGSGG